MKLYFFKAPWCAACHSIDHLVPEKWQRIDCEADPEMAMDYNIASLPTFLITDDSGMEIAQLHTTNLAILDKWVDECQSEK